MSANLRRWTAGVLGLWCAVTAGCAGQAPPTNVPVPPVLGLPSGSLALIDQDGEVVITLVVAIAETPESQSRGLMGVRKLEEGTGMAFLFSAPAHASFHMKDVVIPLDIAFWGEDLRITEVISMEPCKADPCARYLPRSPFVGAVEVSPGTFPASSVGLMVRVTQGGAHPLTPSPS